MNVSHTPLGIIPERVKNHKQHRVLNLAARGEPYTWILGGALALGILLIVGFLSLIIFNGLATFWPRPIAALMLKSGEKVAGELSRTEAFRPGNAGRSQELNKNILRESEAFIRRTLYRIGNFDLYNEEYRWIVENEITVTDYPSDLLFIERLEWGPFIGRIATVILPNRTLTQPVSQDSELQIAHETARQNWKSIRQIEQDRIGDINHKLNRERLNLRRVEINYGIDSPQAKAQMEKTEQEILRLQKIYDALAEEVKNLRQKDAAMQVTLQDINGAEKTLPLSNLIHFYPANSLSIAEKISVYLWRWWNFLSEEPREANTEGGVFPAIFGTFAMTLLLVIVVTPFGVITALYLREYAHQGRLVSIVRIAVNNLAGVPSIVYGVFGLGFFAYILGGNIDQVFFSERLPNPTFGTGGLLWAALTLAILTVPVVIVSTEEALAAVPRSMREGSLACGASKWQTIKNIVLPRAMPGIMTGVILAMARGAGEVAPLMLVGVVKLAPELPIDQYFPYIHFERSFMHLGFHIFDVGFQSRNSEAAKPMVFVTTLLLIALIFAMNFGAILLRNRLKRKFAGSQF